MIAILLTLMLGLVRMDSYAADTIKVVSYNVNFFSEPALVTRDFKTQPEIASADIILLQEVTRDLSHDWDPVTRLGDQLGMYSVFIPSGFVRKIDYGNAILSKYPLSNTEMVALPHSSFESKTNIRSGMIADLMLPNGTLLSVASVHLSVMLYDRSGQLEVLLARLQERGAKNIIFGGDLNTSNPIGWSSVEHAANKYHYTLSHPHTGWTMKGLHLKLDHLFHQGDMIVSATGIAKRSYGSDHLPIWVDYQFSVNTLINNPEHF